MPTPESKVDRIKALAERLERTSRLAREVKRRGDTSVEQEAWQVATALMDIEESTTRLFHELLPRLLTVSPESDAADDVLTDIGEEYRHILYHIRETTLFGYLFADQ